MWHLTLKENRKPWPEFVSGLIKHTHIYEGEPFIQGGCMFKPCTHYGCNMVDPIEITNDVLRMDYEILVLENRIKDFTLLGGQFLKYIPRWKIHIDSYKKLREQYIELEKKKECIKHVDNLFQL